MNLRIGKMAWMRPYFVTLCAVAVLLGAYSWIFVSGQKTESIERRYRVLSSVSTSIVKRLDHLQRWASNTQRDRATSDKGPRPSRPRRLFEGLKPDSCKTCSPKEGEVRIDLDGSVHVVDAADTGSPAYRSTLKEILGVLNDGDFDAVLIVLTTGQVIEQQSRGGSLPELTQLRLEPDGQTVVVQDQRYRLFLSPVSLSVGTFVRERALSVSDLQLAGLVSESTLVREAMQLPYGLVVALGALILLGTVALPFFRFYYLDPTEPYRRGDVLVLVLSGLIGIAAATILLLDTFAGGSIAADLDRDAEAISDAVLQDLGQELDFVAGDLRTFFERDAWWEDSGLLTAEGCVAGTPRCISSGYVDTVLRIAADGTATEKWTNAEALSWLRDYGDRPYFRIARNGVLSTIQSPAVASPEPYVFDIVRIRSTGMLSEIVALPRTSDDGKLEVLAASFRSRVLSAPVLPAGYTMMVINQQGEVFEHSGRDPLERQRSENLLAEISEPRDLEAAMLTRGADRIEIRYRGSTHSAYITPLGGFPFFLLVLRDQSLANAIGLEIVGASLVLYCTLVVALCGVIAFWSHMCGRRLHDLLWPDPRRARGYTRVAWLSLGCVALWALAAGVVETITSDAMPSWPIVIALPVLQIALLVWGCRPTQTARASDTTAHGYLGLSMVLALTLGALPAAVLYCDAFDAHMETLVRLDQLTIVRGIDETVGRRTRIFADLCRDANQAGCALRAWHPSSGTHHEAHGTAVSNGSGPAGTPRWTREPTIRAVYLSRALAESVEPIAGSAPDPMDRPGRTAAQLPLLLRSPAAWLLSAIPAYSEQSKQFRRLLIDGESSGRWSFSPISPSGTTLTDRASWAGPLRVKSLAPSAVDVLASSAGRVAFLSLVALLLLALLRALSKVVVQGLFGPAPHGTLERRPESLGAARAMVLVAPRPDIDTVMRTYPRASVFCLDLRQPRELWMGAEQAARQGVSKVFLLDRLEDLLEEGSRVEDLLVLLRQLLDDAPSTVVLLCEEDPFAILDAELARAEQGHTMPRAILQQLRSRMSDAETPEIAEIAAALSSPDASLDPSEEALGKVAERHYRELWEECSVPERLVLFHVARDGFISRNGWGLVARLQRRGLVRKDPVLRIMNQSFRAFVLRAETLPTIKEWEEETGAGGAHVRGALTVAALAAGAFFLFTQRDQLTALATILPPLAAILSFVPRMFAAIPSNRASGGSSESS